MVCLIENLEVFLFQVANRVALRISDYYRDQDGICLDYDFSGVGLWCSFIGLLSGQVRGREEDHPGDSDGGRTES